MSDHDDDTDHEDESEGRALAAPSATQLAALKQLGQAAAAVVAAHPHGGGDPLLRMTKTGEWVYGQESLEVEKDSEWAVNPQQVAHGWICWNRDPKSPTRKLGESMVSIGVSKPDRLSLPEIPGGEWSEQISLQVRCMTGEDRDVQCVYKTNSMGGFDACLDLIKQIGERAMASNPAVVPIVTLETDKYNHKSYGLIYKPVFEVVRWVTLGSTDGGGGEPKPQSPNKPRDTAAQEKPQEAAGSPVRTRRSREAA